MWFHWLIYLIVVTCFSVEVRCETRVAIARLIGENVTGTLTFTEVDEGVRVTGVITGKEKGLYGFHVHALGDITSCDSTGGHFDPDGNDHGGPDHEERHVGDLGNIQFEGNETGVANVNFVDRVIALRGRNNIVGRSVVLHEGEDDLGLGGHEMSLITGNAGPRVACGVIAILSPVDPWNSAKTLAPPTVLLLLALFFTYFNRS